MSAVQRSDIPPSRSTATRRPVRTWIIVETALGVPAMVIGTAIAPMSVMMFDAPGSTTNPALIALFASILAFPLACFVGIVSAWIAVARRRDRGAMWFSLLPLLPVVTGVIAIAWLQIANDGGLAP